MNLTRKYGFHLIFFDTNQEVSEEEYNFEIEKSDVDNVTIGEHIDEENKLLVVYNIRGISHDKRTILKMTIIHQDIEDLVVVVSAYKNTDLTIRLIRDRFKDYDNFMYGWSLY